MPKRSRRKEHRPLFVSFSDDLSLTALHINICFFERKRLCNSHARRQQHFYKAAKAEPTKIHSLRIRVDDGNRCEKLFNLNRSEEYYFPAGNSWHRNGFWLDDRE